MTSTSSFPPCSSSSFLASRIAVKSNRSPPATFFTFRRSQISASCATAERRGSASVSSSSLYEVLGIDVGATCPEIKSAYRKLARVLHPDVNVEKSTSPDEFMKIHAAYSTLSDPEKRADYDRSLIKWRRSVSSSFAMYSPETTMSGSVSSTFSGYRRRTWETDQCW